MTVYVISISLHILHNICVLPMANTCDLLAQKPRDDSTLVEDDSGLGRVEAVRAGTARNRT